MNRISVDWLVTFLEVARLQHVGKAADTLQSDQSTISRKIARLEDELDVILFERIGRRVRLTPAGKRFAERTERIVSELRSAIDDASLLASPDRGEIRVGFLHTIGATWLPAQVAPFHATHPRLRFALTDGTAHEIVRGVLAGDFDLGILGPPPRDTGDLATHPLFTQRISVIVPKGHRLTRNASCTLQDLQHESLVLTRSSSGLRGIIDDAFSSRGIEEDVAYEGDDFTIIQGLVEAGLGITLLPSPLPKGTTNVSVIELTDPILTRVVVVCWDRRRSLPSPISQFLRHLIEASSP